MTEVAIPCPSCGKELYDSVRKYHLDVPCETIKSGKRCYDFKGGHWSKGSYCPYCDATVAGKRDPVERAALGMEP